MLLHTYQSNWQTNNCPYMSKCMPIHSLPNLWYTLESPDHIEKRSHMKHLTGYFDKAFTITVIITVCFGFKMYCFSYHAIFSIDVYIDRVSFGGNNKGWTWLVSPSNK